MKRAKAVVIASLIGGISLVFSEVSVPFVFATEEISEMTEAEESELPYENTAESESHSESSTTEQEESQSRHEDASQTESETESPQEEEGRTQGESEISVQETTEAKELNTDEAETTLEESESDTEESTEEMTDIVDKFGQIEKRWKAGTGLTSLRMPQKFAIVMDPWEMDGRTQVYSEQYIIKNTGDVSGTLKLTGIACEAGEDVHVQENSDHIHSGKDKKVYIELLINDEDRIVLMPEGTDYEIELAPDARMTLEFTGAMNENSSENWQDSDVKISVAYDWRVEPQEIESEAIESISETEEEGLESASMTEESSEVDSASEIGEEGTEAESEIEEEDTVAESELEEESTTRKLKSEEGSTEEKSEVVGDILETESESENEDSESVSESEETTSEAETIAEGNNPLEGLSTEEGSTKIEIAAEEERSNDQTETAGNPKS